MTSGRGQHPGKAGKCKGNVPASQRRTSVPAGVEQARTSEGAAQRCASNLLGQAGWLHEDCTALG